MKKFMHTLMAAALASIAASSWAEPVTNPFGLVYEDAITENVPGKVNIHQVKYTLLGNEISANVYTPANYDESKSYPAIVVGHPNGGVKEQVAGLFAQKLAEAGYITIAADASFQGASGGEPRYTDIPFFRTNDIRGMVDYISAFKGTDRERIGALGICGGGGYTLNAVKSDKRIKAVATLSMFNTGDVRRNGYMRSAAGSAQETLKKASDARQQRVDSGETVTSLPDLSKITKESIADIKVDLYREGMEYYFLTHFHPNASGGATVESLMDAVIWDATDHADLINVPLLMIAGEKADSRYMSEEFFEKATGTSDKELYLIKDATHIRTYYVPEYVQAELGKLREFFGRTL